MYYADQFERFDILGHAVDDHGFLFVPIVVARARAFLGTRSRPEILSAARAVSWLVWQGAQRGKASLGAISLPEQIRDGLVENSTTRDVDALAIGLAHFDVADDSEFFNGRDCEYFAVLALVKVSDALFMSEYARGKPQQGLLALLLLILPKDGTDNPRDFHALAGC